MHIKYKVKSLASPRLLSALRTLNRIRTVPSYYIPYVAWDGKSNLPRHLTIELTYRCNLKCAMCPQAHDLRRQDSKIRKKQKSVREMTTEEVFSVIDQAADLKVREITLTGGEAFAREDIIPIAGRVKERSMQCTILTNGGLITKSDVESLVDMHLDKIVFSLDGPEEIHNGIRNHPKIFQQLCSVMQTIQKVKRERNTNIPDITLTCTISALNYNYLVDVMDVASRYGVNVNFAYLFYTTREMENKTGRILGMGDSKGEDQDIDDSIKQVNVDVLWDQITKIKNSNKYPGIKASFSPQLNKEEIHNRFYLDNHAYANKCFYPWLATRINPYGEVYPCSIGICMGNVKNEKIEAIWNGPRYIGFRKLLKRNKLFPGCAKCCALNTRLWSVLPAL